MYLKKQLQHAPWPITAALGLCLGLTVSALATAVRAGYLTSEPGSPVTNDYGECWNVVGGEAGPQAACGDELPQPTAAITDTDGDGVADTDDGCPSTPPNVAVDARGCPPDSDADGVADYRDQCPDSKADVKVDQQGCAIIENVAIDVTTDHFAVDSADLQPGMVAALNDLIKRVLATPGEERLSIVGHTDSTGAEAHN